MSHYDWLDKNFPTFVERLGCDKNKFVGCILSHADKCDGYKSEWERNSIPFEHGVAIYLLSYFYPWSKEVRETINGWYAPKDWVIRNYDYFRKYLVDLT